MWIFHQSTGILERNGAEVRTGYAGARTLGINTYEAIPYFGPIPRGMYTIGWWFHKKQKYVLSLTPVGHDAEGRTSFLIHGDYTDRSLLGTASQGCIVLPPEVRRAIWESHDPFLWVQL